MCGVTIVDRTVKQRSRRRRRKYGQDADNNLYRRVSDVCNYELV